MPIFFFDVYDGCRVVHDEVGAEHADVHEAAVEAAALLPDFARDARPDAHSQDFAASVRDEAGDVVYRAILVLRGKLSAADADAQAVPALGKRCRPPRTGAAVEERRELGRRLSENVGRLLATVEDSRKVRDESRRALEASRAAHEWLSGKGK